MHLEEVNSLGCSKSEIIPYGPNNLTDIGVQDLKLLHLVETSVVHWILLLNRSLLLLELQVILDPHKCNISIGLRNNQSLRLKTK